MTSVGAGDFNGDGKADLVWRSASDGLTEIQFLNGNTAVGGGAIANNALDASWNVAGVGDFNGDGMADLVWRRASDGLIEVQFMNGNAAIGGGIMGADPERQHAHWRLTAKVPLLTTLPTIEPLCRRCRAARRQLPASPGSGHFDLFCSALTLQSRRDASCVVRLDEKRGLTCLCCGGIDDIRAAVAIAGCDECRRQVITE